MTNQIVASLSSAILKLSVCWMFFGFTSLAAKSELLVRNNPSANTTLSVQSLNCTIERRSGSRPQIVVEKSRLNFNSTMIFEEEVFARPQSQNIECHQLNWSFSDPSKASQIFYVLIIDGFNSRAIGETKDEKFLQVKKLMTVFWKNSRTGRLKELTEPQTVEESFFRFNADQYQVPTFGLTDKRKWDIVFSPVRQKIPGDKIEKETVKICLEPVAAEVSEKFFQDLTESTDKPLCLIFNRSDSDPLLFYLQ